MEIKYKPELNFLQSELNRITDLIQFTDRKSTFLITFYSAFFGIIASQKSSVLANISKFTGIRLGLYWLTIIVLALCFTYGAFHLMRSIFPTMKHELSDGFSDYHSIISYQEFSSENELRSHMVDQIKIVTMIADRKMSSAHKCSKNLFMLVFLAIIFVFLF